MNEVDFRSSYLNWLTKQGSYGRFQICAVSTIGKEEFVLTAGVLACNMYVKKDLIQDPPFLYQAAISTNHYKLFRSLDDKLIANSFGELKDDRFEWVQLQVINSLVGTVVSEDVLDEIKGGAIFMACTKFNSLNGKETVVRYPITHLNYNLERRIVQVECGPVLIPSLSKDKVSLAYIAYNTLQEIEIIRRRDSVEKEGLLYIKESYKCSTIIYKYL
jgi:hypothetical protein